MKLEFRTSVRRHFVTLIGVVTLVITRTPFIHLFMSVSLWKNYYYLQTRQVWKKKIILTHLILVLKSEEYTLDNEIAVTGFTFVRR